MMTTSMIRVVFGISLAAIPAAAQQGQDAAKPKLYNTVIQKLREGKQVFSFTQSTFDIAGYCEAAKHYDYTWFEMQHSTLEFRDVEAMIAACPHAGAIPMIRLPDAAEYVNAFLPMLVSSLFMGIVLYYICVHLVPNFSYGAQLLLLTSIGATLYSTIMYWWQKQTFMRIVKSSL